MAEQAAVTGLPMDGANGWVLALPRLSLLLVTAHNGCHNSSGPGTVTYVHMHWSHMQSAVGVDRWHCSSTTAALQHLHLYIEVVVVVVL